MIVVNGHTLSSKAESMVRRGLRAWLDQVELGSRPAKALDSQAYRFRQPKAIVVLLRDPYDYRTEGEGE